jgi:SAM-dependent methyltransferase
MPLPHRYTEYDNIARVYNRHWGDRFLPTALAALEKLALPRIPKDANILDLCCGTGQLALELTRRGYNVTGLDGSGEMLGFARRNAPGAEFILDDARSFALPPRFHLAVSMFDSLNHILVLAELSSVFSNVFTALQPNGLFLFDMITEAGYRANWDGFSNIVAEDYVYAGKNSYDPARRIAKLEATIFRLENGWQRSDVTLPERCYSETEIRSALEAAGFVKITAHGLKNDGNIGKLTAKSERAFFLCRRLSGAARKS